MVKRYVQDVSLQMARVIKYKRKYVVRLVSSTTKKTSINGFLGHLSIIFYFNIGDVTMGRIPLPSCHLSFLTCFFPRKSVYYLWVL